MVTLKEIELANFDSVIALAVRPDQQNLVATNVESIAQAYVQRGCIPLAICAGEEPVGFVMYCVDPDDGEWWLYRLMVDARYQGKGYGRDALTQVLDLVRSSGGHPRMFLGVDPSGGASLRLYESIGFRFSAGNASWYWTGAADSKRQRADRFFPVRPFSIRIIPQNRGNFKSCPLLPVGVYLYSTSKSWRCPGWI